MNLPNIISLIRLISVPLIIWMVLQEYYLMALMAVILAGLSDALDGILARLLKAHTTLGAYLDPLADKALLVSLFVTLGIQSLIPTWLVISVVFRDILIIGGAFMLFMFDRPFKVKPIIISKINTFFQVMVIIFVLIHNGLKIDIPVLSSMMFQLTGISTILSGGAYVFIWLKHMNGEVK